MSDVIINTLSFFPQPYQRSREAGPRTSLYQQQFHHWPQHRKEPTPEQADGGGVQETRGGTQKIWKLRYNDYTHPKLLEWHGHLICVCSRLKTFEFKIKRWIWKIFRISASIFWYLKCNTKAAHRSLDWSRPWLTTTATESVDRQREKREARVWD